MCLKLVLHVATIRYTYKIYENFWKQSESHEMLCFHVKTWIISSVA